MMPSNKIGPEWIRKFEVCSPKRNCRGETVYKVVSVVYPRNAPEAITKLVVWRSYSDFLNLHKNIRAIAIDKGICEDLPCTLTDSNEYSQSAKELLTFVGNHSILFLSEYFRNFFESESFGQLDELGMSKNRGSDCYNCTRAENNNVCDKENINPMEDEFVVIEKPTETTIDVPEAKEVVNDYNEPVVICKSEKPVILKSFFDENNFNEVKRYRVVDILDVKSRVFLVRREDKPGRRYILKVHRRNWWREDQNKPKPFPRPIPYMSRLVYYTETEYAIFEVTTYTRRGRLWDLLQSDQLLTPSPVCTPDDDSRLFETASVDEASDLVANAQRLLASVSRTMNRSEQATSSLQRGLDRVERVLAARKKSTKDGGSRRSQSVKRRLERRLSSDDISSTPRGMRTAQPSLDRASDQSTEISQQAIPVSKVRLWAAQMVTALDTLHTNGIIWRDFNPRNILVDDHGQVVLTFHHDWRGLEKPLDSSAVHGLFVAPELLNVRGIVTSTCDWWSLGAVCYQLLTGMALRSAHPHGIESYTSLHLPEFLSVESASFLRELLQYEIRERLGGGLNGVEDIKCHPFFDQLIDWREIAESI